MTDIVHVVAVLTTQPGKRDEVLEIFNANVPAVHAEDGCIEYQAVVDMADVGPVQTPIGPDTFMVIEKWETLQALAAHGAAPHMKEFGAKVKDMIKDRAVHVLQGV